MVQCDRAKEATHFATSAELMETVDFNDEFELNSADMMIGHKLTMTGDVNVNPTTVALSSTTCSVGDSNSNRHSTNLRNFSISGTSDCGYTVLVSRGGKAILDDSNLLELVE